MIIKMELTLQSFESKTGEWLINGENTEYL